MLSSTSPPIQYRPLPAAHQIHGNHQVRERALIGGIGSGKTHGGAWDSLLQALEWNAGFVGMITAPDYPMLSTSTKRTFLEILPPQMVRSFNKSDNHLVLTNGSEVYFRSANDPDKLRGPNLAWFWLDEGQEATGGIGGVWDVLIGRLRQGNQPSGLLTGTPSGMNWVYERFGKAPLPPDRCTVRARTRDNFHLPPEYVAHLEATYVGDFARQELEGEFVAFQGLVYRDFRPDKHILQPPRIEWRRKVVGVDFGFTNPTVMLVVGEDADGRAWVLDEFYERRITEAQMQDAAGILRQNWQTSEFFCDTEDPRLIQAIGGYPAIKDLIPGIQAVTARLQVQGDGKPRLFIAPHCVNLIRELQTYRYPERAVGKVIKDVPLKVDDHACDALRYAIQGLDHQAAWFFIA